MTTAVHMVLAEKLLDIRIQLIGAKRETPPDATGDFYPGIVCEVLAWVEHRRVLVRTPFAQGEWAYFYLESDLLLPG